MLAESSISNSNINTGDESMLFIVDVKDCTADFVAKLPVQRMQTGKIDVEATACTDTRHECSSVAQRMHERLRTGNNQVDVEAATDLSLSPWVSSSRLRLWVASRRLGRVLILLLVRMTRAPISLTRSRANSLMLSTLMASSSSAVSSSSGFTLLSDRSFLLTVPLTFWAVRLRAQRRPWLLGDDVGGGAIVRASGRVRQSRG